MRRGSRRMRPRRGVARRGVQSRMRPRRGAAAHGGSHNGCGPGMHMMPNGTCMEGAYHGASAGQNGGYRRRPLRGASRCIGQSCP
jgi:hypothetical protein